MDIFAMFFVLFMITAAGAAIISIALVAGGLLGGIAFAITLFALYKAFTHQDGPDSPISKDALNAFQTPLSDD